MSSFPSGDLQVVVQTGDRYLFNHRDAALERVQIADLLVTSNEGSAVGPYVFPAPVYEVQTVPPHAYVQLPSRDDHLDGYTLWRIDAAEWEDGRSIDAPLIMPQRKLWGGAVFTERQVQREVKHLRTEPERQATPAT